MIYAIYPNGQGVIYYISCSVVLLLLRFEAIENRIRFETNCITICYIIILYTVNIHEILNFLSLKIVIKIDFRIIRDTRIIYYAFSLANSL